MAMNKGLMAKHRRQVAERCGLAHIRACVEHRADPLYDVYDGDRLISEGLTLVECASLGRGYQFKQQGMVQ